MPTLPSQCAQTYKVKVCSQLDGGIRIPKPCVILEGLWKGWGHFTYWILIESYLQRVSHWNLKFDTGAFLWLGRNPETVPPLYPTCSLSATFLSCDGVVMVAGSCRHVFFFLLLLFLLSFPFFFPPLLLSNMFVVPNWQIARLDTAAFAKRSQTASAASRTVNVEQEINKRYSFNEICFLKNIYPFYEGLCASRQRMANGKCLPLDNVRVAFPPFFLLCGNICPSTRTHATI